MPTYVYKGKHTQTYYEIEHSLKELPLSLHPETQEPLERIYLAPNLSTKHTPGTTQKLLDNNNLAKNGFQKYEKDKTSGGYYRTV